MPELDRIDTTEGQKRRHGTQTAGERTVVEGATRDRVEPGKNDRFALNEKDRAKYGIEAHEDPRWIRSPNYWKDREFSDRAWEFEHEENGDGNRVVMYEGQFVHNGDLILAASPTARRLELEKQQERETEEFRASTEDEMGEIGDVTRWDDANVNYPRLKAEARRKHRESGMIGETQGMKFADVLRSKGESKFLETQARFRAQGRHRTDVQTEAQEKRMVEARREGSSKFTVGSIPANVRPKNTMEAANARRAASR